MKRATGFTLTEFMVVLAIVAILLGIGVPSYRYVTNASRASSEINALLGDLMYARAEAIKEGQTVSLCVSSDGANCSGSLAWGNGWIVFPDPTASDTPAAGAVLRVQQAFTGNTPDSLTSDTGISAVSFNRDGFSQNVNNGPFPATTMTLHDPTANVNWTKCLLISVAGMMQTETAIIHPYGNCT